MTLIIDEGFEGPGYEESWSESIGTSCSIDDANQDITIDGSYVLRCVMADTGNFAYAARILTADTIPSTSLFYLFFKFQFTAWSDNDRVLFSCRDNAANINVRAYSENTAGDNIIRLNYYNNGVFSNVNTTTNMSVDTTYDIEILYDPVGLTFECWIDGVQQFTPITLSGTLRGGFRFLRLGVEADDGYVGTQYFDTVKVDDSDRIGGGDVVLVTQGLTQGQSLDNVSLIQSHVLSTDPLDQAQTLDNVTLLTATILVINPIDQNQTLDNVSVIQQSTISIDPTEQGQVVDNISVIQQSTLSIDPSEQGQTLENITLSTATILAIAKLIQSQNIDVVTLLQQSTLSVDPLDQAQTLENITLDSGILLGIANMIQGQTLDNIDLTQAYTLGIDALEQGQVVDNVIISIFEGKIFIELTLKKSDIDITLKKPNIDITIN